MATFLYRVVVWTFEDGNEARPSIVLQEDIFAGNPVAAQAQAIADALADNPEYEAGNLQVAVDQYVPLGPGG
jgi:hypothetical protein